MTVLLIQMRALAGTDSLPSPRTGLSCLAAIIQPETVISALCDGKGGKKLSSSFSPFLSACSGVSCSFPPVRDEPPTSLSVPVIFALLFISCQQDAPIIPHKYIQEKALI